MSGLQQRAIIEGPQNGKNENGDREKKRLLSSKKGANAAKRGGKDQEEVGTLHGGKKTGAKKASMIRAWRPRLHGMGYKENPNFESGQNGPG